MRFIPSSTHSGFTLAELLVSLLILAEIATFTIPKILSVQQNNSNKANAKDVAAMISGAYQQAQLAGIVNGNTRPSNLTPYMNYVAMITDGRTIDAYPGLTTRTCDATNPCISLHGGGLLWLQDMYRFGLTTDRQIIEFVFDPDGTYSGSSADSSGKSVQFSLYYTGRLTTRGKLTPNSCNNEWCGLNPGPHDPSWFNWQ